MHELSIATQIVESVSDAVAAQPATVAAVNVRVGAMSGVIPEALQFAWDVAAGGTRLDGSALHIEEVAAAVWCEACDAEREIPGYIMRCPVCGASTPRLVRGKELDILSVELTDEPSEQPTPGT